MYRSRSHCPVLPIVQVALLATIQYKLCFGCLSFCTIESILYMSNSLNMFITCHALSTKHQFGSSIRGWGFYLALITAHDLNMLGCSICLPDTSGPKSTSFSENFSLRYLKATFGWPESAHGFMLARRATRDPWGGLLLHKSCFLLAEKDNFFEKMVMHYTSRLCQFAIIVFCRSQEKQVRPWSPDSPLILCKHCDNYVFWVWNFQYFSFLLY